jgi:hypothetical protein
MSPSAGEKHAHARAAANELEHQVEQRTAELQAWRPGLERSRDESYIYQVL